MHNFAKSQKILKGLLAIAVAVAALGAFVEMDEPLVVGDKFEVGLYPEGAALPASTRTLVFSTETSETEGYVRLMATHMKRGFLIKIF